MAHCFCLWLELERLVAGCISFVWRPETVCKCLPSLPAPIGALLDLEQKKKTAWHNLCLPY